MTTAYRNRLAITGRTDGRGAIIGLWALAGAAPGIALVLLAEFVVDGELQLTIGAPGLLLAVIGAVAGLVVGAVKARRRRQERNDGR